MKRIVYLSELIPTGSSCLDPAVKINSSYAFVHDRSELGRHLNLADLNVVLTGLYPLEVKHRRFEAFSDAISYAAELLPTEDIVTVWDKSGNAVCHVLP